MGDFRVVTEHTDNCLRSCDYKSSNIKHSYNVRYNKRGNIKEILTRFDNIDNISFSG